MPTSKYIMIGGFLGAGKTTVIQRFAHYLAAKKHTVGLITNDQGAGLVDSAIGRSNQFPVEEISGGCFCCRFNSLIDAARNLTKATRPDVFLAEPVGSCTDLVATVSLPLQKIYGDDYTVSPLSVLIDPLRARQVLGLSDDGKKFSKNVTYIYRKQLEEAEFIVINKLDLLDDDSLGTLRSALEKEFPDARIFEISARDGTGCEDWFEAATSSKMNVGRFLDIDYDRYGEGEALLGWLNMTVAIEDTDTEFDGNKLLKSLAGTLRKKMTDADAEVAHLKMTLTPLADPMEIGAINLVRGNSEPELSHHLIDPLDDGELLLNIRAETAPETLEGAATAAIEAELKTALGLTYKITHTEHFRPGMPTPTHRMTADS
ncbi:CobW-like GTP-binding protein [Verrucomicrobiales bacterium]|nr:CobW-like GTP-binding protein [Verrucomicrobiales bacterium]MDC0322277.1 CobW-like GTP-binding protein [Verrucomicrobiales bacterium]